MNWYSNGHFEDKESGITGWGFLPTLEQQQDRDATLIIDLQLRGYNFAEVLPTRSKRDRINWRFGNAEQHLETHWQIFEPGYATEEDELIAESTDRKIQEYRDAYKDVWCVSPTADMKIEAGYFEEFPEGHGAIAIMVLDS